MTIQWKPEKLIHRIHPDRAIQIWLKDDQSLTAKLRCFCPGINVEILNEAIEKPLKSEADYLGLTITQKVWVRSIVLKCHEIPLIYARTVIPYLDENNPWHNLQNLGTKPLGEILFDPKQPAIRRLPFRFARTKLSQLPYLLKQFPNIQEGFGLARQSVFLQHQSPLLLTEVFLPDFCTYPKENIN